GRGLGQAEGPLRSGGYPKARPHVCAFLGTRRPMHTNFTRKQLEDPRTAEVDKILRRCVHCGFCTATCPTYVLLGDERDSPRGRIYLMKDMFEQDRAASAEVHPHIDRCLSGLSWMTTRPTRIN